MKNQSPSSLIDKVVNERYRILKKIKDGGFGSVYLANDIKHQHRRYALKLIKNKEHRSADNEYSLYCLMAEHKFTHGFVKMHQFGDFQKNKYILLELIGKDLEEVMNSMSNSRFSIKTCLMIGLQAIDRIQALHTIGYLHQDVKPDNLAIGLQEKNTLIYLIDFGLAQKINKESNSKLKTKVMGTAAFMSCRAHQGKQQHPSDDLEALIYSMLYMMQGSLPWMKIQCSTSADLHRLFLLKKTVHKNMFKKCTPPEQLFETMQYLRTVKGNLDYLKVKYYLINALKSIHAQNDFKFDWVGAANQKEKPQVEMDSPRKRAVEVKMLGENQRIIQNQLFEIYKFIGEQSPDIKKRSPTLKKGLRNIDSPLKKEVKKEVKDVKTIQRPVTAHCKAKQSQIKDTQAILQLRKFQQTYINMGPRIIINKLAKHKI